MSSNAKQADSLSPTDARENFFLLLRELFRRPEDYDRLIKTITEGGVDERLARFGRRRGIAMEPHEIQQFLEFGQQELEARKQAKAKPAENNGNGDHS